MYLTLYLFVMFVFGLNVNLVEESLHTVMMMVLEGRLRPPLYYLFNFMVMGTLRKFNIEA